VSKRAINLNDDLQNNLASSRNCVQNVSNFYQDLMNNIAGT